MDAMDEEEKKMCTKPGCNQPAREGHPFCLEHVKENDGFTYGMDSDVSRKLAAKFDSEKAEQVQKWIEELLGEPFPDHIHGALRSGVILCKLVNRIKPGAVARIHTEDKAFFHRENIEAYLEACRKLGMQETDLFVTQDLYEGDDMVVVLDNLFALSALSQHPSVGFPGPYLVASTNYILREHRSGSEANRFQYDEYHKGKILQIDHQKYRIDVGIRPYKPTEKDQKCKVEGCNEGCYIGKDMCLEHFKAQEDFEYGIRAEVKAKLQEKLAKNESNVEKVTRWLEAITGERISENLQEALKSGVILCKALNAIVPGTIAKIHTSTAPFRQMENISNYLEACKKLGQKEGELFVTRDLYENANMVQVVDQIMGLGGLAQRFPDFKGPHIGVARQDPPPTMKKWEVKEYVQSVNGVRLTSGALPGQRRESQVAKQEAAEAAEVAQFCAECGTKREDLEAQFCAECGAKIEE